MKIYEIKSEIRKALDSIEVDPETGEILNGEALTKVQDISKEKIANCARYIREEEHEIEAMRATVKAIQERIKTKERKIDWLRDMTILGLEALGENVEMPDIRVSTRKSESIEVDEKILDRKWFNRVETYKPNKTLLKQMIKNGTAIEGANLVTNINLSIK